MMSASLDELFKRWNVSRESQSRLEVYVSLLLTWQKRINLIGASTVDDIWSRHVADSLQLLPLLPVGNPVIADLGSGAGLPGLVLAMVTGFETHLYESNGKKGAFLREAIRETRASAILHHLRIETLGLGGPLPKADVVVARALAPLTQLLNYAAPFLDRRAIGLFHKGQGIEAELAASAEGWKLTCVQHPSISDSKGIILEVQEAIRVGAKTQF